MHTVADALRVRVCVAGEAQHVGVRGAALLAARGLGWVKTLAPEGFFPSGKVFEPDTRFAALHDARYRVYAGLHSALADSFQALADVPRAPGGCQ
mmetsp:Transcript_83517/g.231674  ORF Transcript_83517/g.231674 Transcript_83517/m.231674 type:complete len:95 (+) Transcript_83517:194-478(+)